VSRAAERFLAGAKKKVVRFSALHLYNTPYQRRATPRRCESPKGTTHEDYLRYWIYVLESATAIANRPGGAPVTSTQYESCCWFACARAAGLLRLGKMC